MARPGRRHAGAHGALRADGGETPARLYLLAPVAESIADGLPPLRLLGSLARTDVTAFATGRAGTWSRLLAPRLGARVINGSSRESTEAGPPMVHELSADYGLPMMGPLRDLYGVVGGSVARSLAPRIYTRAFARSPSPPSACRSRPSTSTSSGASWSSAVWPSWASHCGV